jgi:hypothetical protein
MAWCSPSHAIWLSERDGVAWLQGSIADGDEAVFQSFLEKPRGTPLRVLYLESPGGRVLPGLKIAHAVRKAGLTTAVDAARSACDSACTYIFVAGVRRHYVNSESVHQGLGGPRSGLGFHPAHRKSGNERIASELHERGTERARAHYAAMGAPRAASFMDQASFNTLYRINGPTALTARVATSLSPP